MCAKYLCYKFTYMQHKKIVILIRFYVLGNGNARKAFFYAYFETSEYINLGYFN